MIVWCQERCFTSAGDRRQTIDSGLKHKTETGHSVTMKCGSFEPLYFHGQRPVDQFETESEKLHRENQELRAELAILKSNSDSRKP